MGEANMEMKEKKRIEETMKIYGLEIISVCRNCGEHWTTINEYTMIDKCENCKTGEYLRYFVDVEDLYHNIIN